MAYDKSKGLLAVATSYSNGTYGYEKIDQYFAAEDLTITPNQMQDLDSYVNANGYLKRNVLPHSRTKTDGNSPYLTYAQKKSLISILNKGMTVGDGKCNKAERKVRVRYYDDWTDDYEHMYCYIPDVSFQYGGTYKGHPTYLPVRIAFIEY
jgi:hypothetical protein